MTDPHSNPSPRPEQGFDLNRPTIIALLYLVGVVTSGITSLIGVVLAHVWQGEAKTGWEASHYRYLIRTFWIAFALSLVGIVLIAITLGLAALIAWPAFLLLGAWVVVRSVMSLMKAQKQAPMPDPQTLLF